MLKLSDIMTRDVMTVSPDLSVRDAMELLSARRITGAPVVAGNDLVGVVSASDLMELAAQLPGSPTEQPVSSEWEEPLAGDFDEDGNAPAAAFFLDMWDDAGADTAVRFSSLGGPEWNTLEEHTVSEAMTHAPICALPPSTPVAAAADYMRRLGIHRVLVVEGEELVGIVTTTDVARAAAEHRLDARTYMFDSKSRFDERGWE